MNECLGTADLVRLDSHSAMRGVGEDYQKSFIHFRGSNLYSVHFGWV